MGPQAGREVRPMRDLTVRATSCYHSASKEIWLGLGLRYERVTMLRLRATVCSLIIHELS